MSLTPVGDWLRRRYPPNDGATHSLGAGDDPGCCAGPHPSCTYDSGWREALRSLAAELEKDSSDRLFTGGDEGTATGLRFAARLARTRAEKSPS
jgi:hypothetical protein